MVIGKVAIDVLFSVTLYVWKRVNKAFSVGFARANNNLRKHSNKPVQQYMRLRSSMTIKILVCECKKIKAIMFQQKVLEDLDDPN